MQRSRLRLLSRESSGLEAIALSMMQERAGEERAGCEQKRKAWVRKGQEGTAVTEGCREEVMEEEKTKMQAAVRPAACGVA